MPAVLVSACLLGVCCRHDGSHRFRAAVAGWSAGRRVIGVCPEELGALGTPRPPASLVGGDGTGVLAGRARVVDAEGRDVTAAYLAGAREALRRAREAGVTQALLKERSPSCGARAVHRDGRVEPGQGVAAALLRQAGIEVVSDEALPGSGPAEGG
ncbi:MAG: DUF523 domain-containing protein [Deltaproteobacteria bacterium]|nr:DUF523 domain-containing protein [Deltaproteobacteria bacterium]MBI3077767.1 DUF523 domain-containing protein [Deltaproteobacteria bacterium]